MRFGALHREFKDNLIRQVSRIQGKSPTEHSVLHRASKDWLSGVRKDAGYIAVRTNLNGCGHSILRTGSARRRRIYRWNERIRINRDTAY